MTCEFSGMLLIHCLFVAIPDSNHLYGPIPTELGLLSTLTTLNLGRDLTATLL
jgi:hypothetical protein